MAVLEGVSGEAPLLCDRGELRSSDEVKVGSTNEIPN